MLSHANVSAAQAISYYEKDDYYTQGNATLSSDSQWQGQGAATLNLSGPVEPEPFQQLLQGQTPEGKSLHAKRIDPSKHRAATDYTFSAPKSVSIAALIQKDRRVIAAHDQAVKTALSVLENRYAQTRVRRGKGIRDRVQTGNIIAATFRHETSREQDPQLHTHCVVINATQLADGQWQSMANEEVLNNQKLLGEIYQNELAVQLRQLGYEIEPQGNGVFECKGYDQPLLDLFSTRSQQIAQYIERWESALAEQGGQPLHEKQKKQATLATRLRKKTVPREVLLEGWQRAISTSNLHLPATPDRALIAIPRQAAIAAAEGVSHASERESVFRREKAERFALEHHLGEQTFSELQQALPDAGLIAAQERYTTTAAIRRELETIAMMELGQGQVNAIANPEQLSDLLQGEETLTEGQRQAIETTARSHDQFIAWQGVAGAGKTYSLKLLAQLATEQGYSVSGYAPSAEAANVLSEEATIESTTVARLLHSQGQNAASKPVIWVVDEAGLLSAKAAHELLTKAQANRARVILVGDTRQLSAVEAGNPFKSLQSAGLKTAYLEESRRQQTAALRTAVVCLAAGEPVEGLTQLERAGMMREIGSSEARQSALVSDYMARSPEARKQTLILSGTNVERLALTAALRTALQAEGDLGQDTFTLRSLRSQGRTIAQLKYACAYEVGDVVVPVKDYRRYGMKRREQYTVLSRDLASNQLTLQAPDGHPFLFNPTSCTAKTTYAVQKIAISPGEQLRWTRNEAVKGVRNGQLVTVEKIDANGKATVRDRKGDTMSLDLTGQQYLDYALVSTTYSSQGKTADQVLATIDSTVSKEGLYVAVSRAKRSLKLYTADKAQLYQKAERSSAQANPSDYLSLFEMVNPDAPTPQAARDLHRRDRAESIGDRLGERVRESRGPTLRRGSAATSGREQLEWATERTRRATERVSRATAEISQTTEHFSGGIRAAEAASQRAATAAIEQLEAINQRTRQRAKWLSNRRLYQSVYQHYASTIHHDSPQERERLIAERLVHDRLQQRGKHFGQQDVAKVRLVFLQGPISQRLKHTQGRAAAWQYADKVVKQELKTIQKQQERDQGMSI